MRFIRPMFTQVVFIAPALWLLGIFLNWLYHSATGGWGWIYPHTSYRFFSFMSLGNWVLAVIVIYLAYRLWFIPGNVNFLLRIGIIACLGFIVEFLNGYTHFYFTGEFFFVWPGSGQRFIAPIALPMWVLNAAVYHYLSVRLVNLHS